MYLDYSKIPFDHFGRPETPTLFLQTLSGDTLGVIPGVSNLNIRVKFSEPSEMDFDVAAKIEVGGELADNPLYSELTGQRVIHTKVYGNYIIINPEDNNDGINDTIHIKAYSLEKHWEKKLLFLEEGTFNFWNPANRKDTIVERMIELMPGWGVGYISPTLIGKYRTFDQYDDYLLDFAYNTIPEKYRCVCVFDTYEKTINFYDVDEQYDTIPIYLDFDNLLKEITVNELTDELVTAIKPYGENDLDILAVNPIGENYIYNLDYFIINGDISGALADKWNQWQIDISNRQQMYFGLMALRNSRIAQQLTEEAMLVDMDGILTGYQIQHDVTRQARDMEEPGSAGWNQQETVRLGIVQQIEDQEAAMAEKEAIIANIKADIETYDEEIKDIRDGLAFKDYFTSEEQEILSNYIIQQVLTEETFVSSDFSGSGTEVAAAGTTSGGVVIEGSSITQINMMQEYNKTMYTFEGGSLSHSGDYDVSGDIIRGTLELTQNLNEFILTVRTGYMEVDGVGRQSGIVTLYGNYSNVSSDIHEEYDGDVQYLVGTQMSFDMSQDTVIYVSGSVGDYETYAVQMELYEYAKSVLNDIAYPAYEFSIQSGNFIFAQEFEAFRNQLQLGRGIHLNLGNGDLITPYLIEFSVDFENHEQLDLVFSSRFKRHDQVNTLKEMIERSYSSSRSFDSSKYTYNQTVNKQSEVDKFINGELDAARNTILAAADQSVIIDGAGIRVNGNVRDGNTNKDIELRIVNGMIAMSDDNWNTARLAIGYFKDSNGSHYGVNADVLAGKLLVGNNLVIENETDQGIMQFKVDQTGAWLYNSQLLLQSDDGGGIMIHPDYGFVVGGDTAHPLYTTSGTTVTPSFIDSETGDVIDQDSDGLPDNVNFYIDTEGNVSMKGNILADSGDIGGWIIDDNMLYSGSNTTYVALNTSGSNTTSAYAIWAGAENAGSAPFFVKRDGTVRMENGDFQGTISGGSININDNFIVDDNGNVTLNGNITWGEGVDRPVGQIYALYARTKITKPTNAYSSYPATSMSGWHKTLDADNDYYTSYSYDNGETWTDAIKTRGSDGTPGSGATVTRNAIVDAMLDAETQDGLYTYTINGTKYLGINATSINTGRISSARNNNNWWDLDTGELHVSGNSISITAGDNISNAIDDGVATANSYTDEQLGSFSDTIDDYMEEFQGQINGLMVTYYYDYEPTLQNVPAYEWVQNGTESDHEGDLFFWKTTGRAYRFMEVNDEWVWQPIRDQGIVKALEDASRAQDTADNKRRVFTSTPTPPYDAGDIWMQGATGDIVVCVYEEGRADGEDYVESDWVKKNKYTDDSAVDNLEIGGRNLLLKTGTSSTSPASSSESTYTDYWDYSDYGQECFEGNIIDKFTISFDYEITGGESGSSGEQPVIYPAINGIAWGNEESITANETGHYVQSGVMKSAQATYASDFRLRVRLQYAANGSTIKVSNLKLEKGTKATDWTPAPEDVQDSVNALYTWKDTTYASTMQSITGQLDRKIETWYRATDPTLDPEVDWENSEHIGDIWFNSSTGVTSQWDGSTWNEMTSNPPASVFNTINTKKQIFVSTPTPPYAVGDLWVQGSGGDILRCAHDRNSGDYVESDWVAASKYTDDTTADAAYALAQSSITSVDVEYAKNQSNTTAPTTGWSTNAPAWEAGYYIWQRTATTLASGRTEYSTALCITGVKGDTGKGVSSTEIRYGTSSSASTEPTNWSASAPTSLSKGTWLWARTKITYTDSTTSTTYNKSYVGTDGEDGTSISIVSTTKNDGVTTVSFSDGTSIVINDGEDGDIGTPGLAGYVHIAWANSADGSVDFSTSKTTGSADKQYMGVYTDNTQADSQNYSDYSWSLIKGEDGKDGKGVKSTAVTYQASTSGTTTPTGTWRTTVPTVSKGQYLWARTITTYTDDTTSTSYSVSYIGTDGHDGKSVYVQNVSKVDGVTTVTLSDGTTTSELIINDGEDGDTGTPGANGYMHVAWATSADGSTGFSTRDSVGKTYIGVYTDNTEADSQTYSDYSWSLIKGEDGVGISSIVEQYYLSTSNTTQAGGSWGNTCPEYVEGRYYWTRSFITWEDNTTSTTTPVLAGGINSANEAVGDIAGDLAEINDWISTDFENTINDVRGQIDGKADTYYQATDPSNEWDSGTEMDHKGDLWYDTSTGKSKMWTGTDWAESDVPDSVYDKIDGKAQIFTGPTTPTGANVGDLWFKGVDEPILTYVESSPGNFTWLEYNKYTDDTTVNNLTIGVRNLMINTLIPDVSAASKRPKILNQGVDTEISGNSTLTTANHGVRLTTTSAVYPWIRFGTSTLASGTMIGLKAGQTYTMSFDAEFKLYSGSPSTSTAYTYRMVLYYATASASSWSSKAYTIHEYSTSDRSDRGAVVSKRAEITFEVPSDVAKCYIIIRPSSGTNSHFASGDYFELSNLQLERGSKASDWSPAPEDLEAYTNGQLDAFATTVTGYVNNLQAQIDGQIETYYYDYEPTLSNVPANAWATADDKAAHEGDLFFWKSKGYAYRFMNNNNTWQWIMVQDTDITLALTNAATAQDTADAKRRVFIVQPTPPYDVGDLWTQGGTGDIMTCTHARSTGSYTASDWSKLNKYTDDTALNNFMSGDYATTINSIQGQIDKKVDTYYQTTDPSTGWSATEKTNHKGDLWYNSTTSVQKYYRWSGSAWQELTATPPKAVFDQIDGKAQIYIGTTTPSNPAEGDLWLKGTDSPILSYVNGEWVEYNKYTSMVENLEIGGRNLIINTLNPDVSSDVKLPRLAGQDTNSGRNTSSTMAVAEHGIKTTVSSATYPWFRFGTNTIASATMNGLEAGSTYTISFDTSYKLYSGSPTTGTTYYYRVILGTKTASASSWTETPYNIHTYSSSDRNDRGAELSDKVSITFTIPEDTTACYIIIRPSSGTLSHYGAGDYMELANMKLEKGSKSTDWTPAPEDIAKEIASVRSYVDTVTDGIGEQIDGMSEQWFYSGEPTANNQPASSWTTNDLKDAHVGDWYYDVKNGYAYRYTKSGSTYSWTKTTDSGVQDALANASKAQDTADNKRRVFVAQPTPPYDIGDLWVEGANGDIKRCKTKKASGSYSASDWVLASKYTDDSAFTAFRDGTYASFVTSTNQGIAAKTTTFYQNGQPTSATSGDLWIDTDDGNKLYRYNGSSWISVQDTSIQAALTKAQNAQTTADGKIMTYSQTSQPTGDLDTGDLWIDTDDNNKLYRWSGSAWVPVTDSSAVENLTIGGRNLLLKTSESIVWSNIAVNSNNHSTKDFYKTCRPVPSLFQADDLVTVSFDWSTTATTGNFHVECGTVTPYKWGTVVNAVGGRASNSNYVDISSTNTSGRFIVTFKVTSSQVGAANTLQWLRIRVDSPDWAGKSLTISNAKAERGSKATDWTPAPEDTAADIEEINNWIEVDFQQTIDDVLGQIDGKADTWYQNADPSTTPSPGWNTTDLKKAHEGDLWYCTDSANTTRYKKVWRWTVSNNAYSWQEMSSVPDDIFDQIDGKAQIFTGTTTPSGASEGDLWFQGTDKPILTYVNGEWQSYNKYTDDSALEAGFGSDNLLLDVYATTLTKVNAAGNRYFSDSSNTGTTGEFIEATGLPDPSATAFIRLSNASGQGVRAYAFYNNSPAPILDGHYYSMSCYARSTTGPTTLRLRFSGNAENMKDFTVTDTWQKYEYTARFVDSGSTTDTYKRTYFYFRPTAVGQSLDMCGFRLRDVTDEVMKSQVVNDNLLPRTKDFASWSRYSGVTLEKDPDEDGINMFHYPAVETVSYRDVTNNNRGLVIPYSVVRDQTVTFSYWVKSSTAETVSSNAYITFSLTTAPQSGRIKYSSNQVPSYAFKQTTEWQKVVFTTTINDALFTSGSGTITEELYFFIQFYNHSTAESWMKKPKLELGSIDTGWCPKSTDDIQGGGSNIIRNSDISINSPTYNIAVLYFGDNPPIEEESYVMQIKGSLGSDRTGWGIYNSGGTVYEGNYNADNKGAGAEFYNEATGIYTIVIPSWKIVQGSTTAANNRIALYQIPNTGTSSSSIEWVKLEHGTVPTEWTLAPEDVDEKIDNVTIGGANLILNGNFSQGAKYWSDWGTPTTREIVTINGKNWLHCVTTSSSYNGYQQRRNAVTSKFDIEPNTEYTLSFTMYASAAYNGNTCGIHWQNNTTLVSQVWCNTSLTTTPKRFSFTFTSSDNVNNCNVMVGKGSNSAILEYWITDIQLEKGNKATDWKPSSEEVDKKIDDIEVGGRNMLLDTNAPSLTAVAAAKNRYFSDSNNTDIVPTYISVTDAPINVAYGVRFVSATATSTNVGRCIAWYSGGTAPMVDGREYTMSAYARVTSGTTMRLVLQYGVGSYPKEYIDITGSTWKQYSWTFTYSASGAGDTTGAGARIYIGARSYYAGTVEMCGFQLERGNKVSDWAPAPEDLEHIAKEAQEAADAAQGAADAAQSSANSALSRFGTCTTAAGTAAKVVTCPTFTSLASGATINVLFTNTNTVANPTLNVNSTGAKGIRYYVGTTLTALTATSYYNWIANSTVTFRYNGTYWVMQDSNSLMDQTATFNRLTKGQTNQGIYLDNGNVYVNATYIKAGYISADRINANTITADHIASNTITANEIKAGTITANEIKTGTLTADKLDATDANFANLVSQYIRLHGEMTVYTDSTLATSGGKIGYASGSLGDVTTNGIKVSNTSGNFYLIVTDTGVRMTAGDSYKRDIFVSSNGPVMRFNGNEDISVTSAGPTLRFENTKLEVHHGTFVNVGSTATSLGSSSYKWSAVYASTGTIQTSDRKQKYDVSYDIDKYIDVFDYLKPVSYKLIDGQSGRTHLGMIAQDIEKTIDDLGINSVDFAAFIKERVDGEDIYGLRYEEFIPILIAKMQQQQKQINALTQKVRELE